MRSDRTSSRLGRCADRDPPEPAIIRPSSGPSGVVRASVQSRPLVDSTWDVFRHFYDLRHFNLGEDARAVGTVLELKFKRSQKKFA